jgi:hypothetical protein
VLPVPPTTAVLRLEGHESRALAKLGHGAAVAATLLELRSRDRAWLGAASSSHLKPLFRFRETTSVVVKKVKLLTEDDQATFPQAVRPPLVGVRNRNSVFHEDANLLDAGPRVVMQLCLASLRLVVQIGASLDKTRDHLQPPCRHSPSPQQRRVAISVFCIHVRVLRKQPLHGGKLYEHTFVQESGGLSLQLG